jgi:hypothetical protein
LWFIDLVIITSGLSKLTLRFIASIGKSSKTTEKCIPTFENANIEIADVILADE